MGVIAIITSVILGVVKVVKMGLKASIYILALVNKSLILFRIRLWAVSTSFFKMSTYPSIR